ncbi:MAG TPA: malonate decarboxylase holo-ACP synthase, partial [Candidatus Acidoferrum sp.]|nr:malonate decarboxylase holo-ACP synthase [Candidatus Acidoferrum sp.]
DLLEIDPNRFIAAQTAVPQWVEENLRKSPFVVVRRDRATGEQIPVGVRGAERNQRWATFCHPKFVKSMLAPPQLLRRTVAISRSDLMPAFRAFTILKDRWMGFNRPWGPGGSVGFELATNTHVVKPESDLDIVLYAERRMTADQAKSLCDRAKDLPAVVDIRVETPACGFSLIEYARAESTAILLRTPGGHLLGDDPWSDKLKLSDAAQSVGERFNAP